LARFTLNKPTLNEFIPLVLLGRDDFFHAYPVKFDQRAMTIGASAVRNTTEEVKTQEEAQVGPRRINARTWRRSS